jgi:hypothetical protein
MMCLLFFHYHKSVVEDIFRCLDGKKCSNLVYCISNDQIILVDPVVGSDSVTDHQVEDMLQVACWVERDDARQVSV